VQLSDNQISTKKETERETQFYMRRKESEKQRFDHVKQLQSLAAARRVRRSGVVAAVGGGGRGTSFFCFFARFLFIRFGRECML